MTIGNCEQIRHDETDGLWRPIANYCPATIKIYALIQEVENAR